MRETPLFLAHGDERLFAVLHEPEGTARGIGFVTCHPFAEEKLWSHRVFVSVARALARRGHAVLRFDHTGAGDSTGDAEAADIGTYVADVRAAMRELSRRRPGLASVGLIGLRLGSAIAALAAEEVAGDRGTGDPPVGPLVLWEPVIDGAAYLQDIMRSNLSGQLAMYGKVIETREVMQQRILEGGSVNVDGYELGKPLFEACNRTDLIPGGTKRHAAPVLLAPIVAARRQKPRPDLDALAASYASAQVRFIDEQPFWREVKEFYGCAPRLEEATLEWLGGIDA